MRRVRRVWAEGGGWDGGRRSRRDGEEWAEGRSAGDGTSSA